MQSRIVKEFKLNKFARVVRQNRLAIAGGLSAVAASSQAALPTGFASAVEQYGTDVVAAIGLMIAAGVLVWGTKKLGSKLGLL
jgi:hypothetical protein